MNKQELAQMGLLLALLGILIPTVAKFFSLIALTLMPENASPEHKNLWQTLNSNKILIGGLAMTICGILMAFIYGGKEK